jgi:acyl-CoA thioesterase I
MAYLLIPSRHGHNSVSKRLTFVILAMLSILAARPASAETVTLLALGDSLTAGLGLPLGDSFPAKLEKALKAKGYDVTVLNAGVSGDTVAQGLARLEWSLTAETDGVIVALGANDMLRGQDPAGTRRDLDRLLTRLSEKKLPVLLSGMRASPSLGSDYLATYDAIFPELAKTHATLFYPFFLDGVAANPRYIQPDGLHPNAAGVDIIVERHLPFVEVLIDRIRQKG